MKTEKIDCVLLSVKDPYNWKMQGKEGISYSASFLIGDKILIAKLTEDVYNQVKDSTKVQGEAIFDIQLKESLLAPKPKCIEFK